MPSRTGKTVLVTGAAGTVGHSVVSCAEAAGYRVVATDLRASGVRVPGRGEVRPADLRDHGALPRLVEGVDFVIHAAAQLDVAADRDELRRVNTDAVAALYQAASAAGVRRFVHMSTAMLYRRGSAAPLGEGAPVTSRGPLGASKLGAEDFLREQSSGPAWTILRAAPIYGRRGRHFAATLLALGPILRLTSPVLPRFTQGPLATMAHAEDVARALVFVLDRPSAEGAILNVASDDPLPLGRRVSETFRAYGLRMARVPSVPRPVGELIGRALASPGPRHGADLGVLGAWRLVVRRHGLKPALYPRIDPEAVTLLHEDLVVDASALRAEGWAPRFADFGAGFRDVLRWYQAERWVPRYA